MRRKVYLYIADNLADLDDDSFVLFNYTMEDLTNPSVVKNSFSQSITLKGTPSNNRIFGKYFRTDRRIANTGGQGGIDYNASQKTPFTIYSDTNEIIESGYIKLDSVNRKGADVEYKVTLYGGLGSFFYALAYDVNGEKRTLASLDYLHTGNTDTELDFTINANAVNDAWQTLMHPSTYTLEPIAENASSSLKPDGTLGSSSTTKVFDFDVTQYCSLKITGRYPGTSTGKAMAVALDANGNALAVYEQGGTRGDDSAKDISNKSITLPLGSVKLRIYHTNSKTPTAKFTPLDIWNAINFAPCYNGVPDGNFSADKAIGVPSVVGLADSVTKDGVAFGLKNNHALFNLAEKVDEWGIKDLRSYLQRPVFSMKAFLDAVCDPSNNGGYEVDATAISNLPYVDTWLTLPMIPSIGTAMQSEGDLTLTRSSVATSGNTIGRYVIGGTIVSGTRTTANLNFCVLFNMPDGADSHSYLYPSVYTQREQQGIGTLTLGKTSAIFIQAIAYSTDAIVVGGSKILFFGGEGTGEELSQRCGFTPEYSGEGYERMNLPRFALHGSDVFEIPEDISLHIEAVDVSYYEIKMYVFQGTTSEYYRGGRVYNENFTGGGDTSIVEMHLNYTTSFTPISVQIEGGVQADTITHTSSSSLRSGAVITKKMLLSTKNTPCDYLLSFAKMFGLHFLYDNALKKVTIVTRNDIYSNETIDLSKRVDISKGIDIKPLAYSSKWYDFILEGAGGAFFEEYKNTEGVDYGIQRVDTGYDFNSESTNLMESVVFRNACAVLARSRYFNRIINNLNIVPSVFVDKGNTYTLWDAYGNTTETEISCPPDTASVTYFNDIDGYDIAGAEKLELREADGKPVDGEDILLFLKGMTIYTDFQLTDDTPVMDLLNDGVPCWIIGGGGILRVPVFSRYLMTGDVVNNSLDLGVPRQLDIPSVTYPPVTIYRKAWANYLADRYDADTKMMTCRVDLSGLQVGQELLRKFWWYENSLWVLNAIRNYSLTTYDPVECEFVQVQDKDNYLNGQLY